MFFYLFFLLSMCGFVWLAHFNWRGVGDARLCFDAVDVEEETD